MNGRKLNWIGLSLGLVVVAMMCATLATSASAQDSTDKKAPGEKERAKVAPITISHFRAHDSRGINVFEAPKEEGAPYEGLKVEWGGAFDQEFQAIHHTNTATPVIVAGVNTNQLMRIGSGFNNAMANMFMDAQLAKGIRVEMTTYLSTRHHNESWVKDGYLLVDASPWENPMLDNIMKYTTLRLGHFEVNYGDAHFRSTDGGSGMNDPLIGNLIMNAFTTEIGGEAYVRANGYMGMVGATGGEIRGTVERPQDRAPTYLVKLGFDKQLNTALRARLMGSLYTTAKSVSNTLYSGSRAGSPYFDVLVNTAATTSAQAWSGDVQPGLSSKVQAMVANPFIKYNNLELFGNFEQAKGRTAAETTDRTWHQNAGEALYRLHNNDFYLAARYNVVKGRFAGFASDVTVDRVEAGGGWFITPTIMMKGEYVKQQYKDFPALDIRNGGEFEGGMMGAVVSF
jgi:hypothetical protein